MTAVASTYRTDVSDQLGDVKPHVARAANIIANALGLTQMSGYGQRSGTSDHPRGLAIDIPATGATGDEVAAFVTKNATALGVKYVIWQQKMWKPATGTWEPMAHKAGDRPGYDPNHMRHVHVSFTDNPPAEEEAGVLERLVQTLGTGVKNLVSLPGSLIENAGNAIKGVASDGLAALNPFDNWARDAFGIGLRIAAVLAGLALVVIGANRLVAPAVAGAVDRTLEVVT